MDYTEQDLCKMSREQIEVLVMDLQSRNQQLRHSLSLKTVALAEAQSLGRRQEDDYLPEVEDDRD